MRCLFRVYDCEKISLVLAESMADAIDEWRDFTNVSSDIDPSKIEFLLDNDESVYPLEENLC